MRNGLGNAGSWSVESWVMRGERKGEMERASIAYRGV
jgi:hypothetical protein